MSASATMEVATTTVLTLMEVMFAPALAATSLTVTDMRVKFLMVLLLGLQ